MSILKFKHADPTRRIPTYLQPYTQENMVWQLKLSALLFVFILGKGAYDEWQWRKKMKKYKSTPAR